MGVTHRLVGQLRGAERFGLGQEVGVIFLPTSFLQITRRYAEFSSALVSINQTFPNERTMQLLGQLQVRGSSSPSHGHVRGACALTVSCDLWAFPGRSGEFRPPSSSRVLLKEGAACLSDQQLRHDAGRADGSRRPAFRFPTQGIRRPIVLLALRACFCWVIGSFWSLARAVHVEGRGYPAVRAASPELGISLCLPLGAGCG